MFAHLEISPSGSVHIGNFREIVTTYFVVRALQDLGKKTRFIFSWDDYDRFRKVPKNVDSSFVKYIGMPYCDIPDPYGCHNSYTEHLKKSLRNRFKYLGLKWNSYINMLNIEVEDITKNILETLYKRKEIYDILMSFKTESVVKKSERAFIRLHYIVRNAGKMRQRLHILMKY